MVVYEAVGGVFAALVAMADVETWEGVSERLGRDGGKKYNYGGRRRRT